MRMNWGRFLKGLILCVAAVIAVPSLVFIFIARPAGTALQFVVVVAGSMEVILAILWLLVRYRSAEGTARANEVGGHYARESARSL